MRKNKRYTRTRVRSSTIGKSVTSPQIAEFFYSFIPRTPTHPSWKIHSTFPAFLPGRIEGAIAIPPSSTRHAITVLLFVLWRFIPVSTPSYSIRISIRQKTNEFFCKKKKKIRIATDKDEKLTATAGTTVLSKRSFIESETNVKIFCKSWNVKSVNFHMLTDEVLSTTTLHILFILVFLFFSSLFPLFRCADYSNIFIIRDFFK